MNPNRDPKVSNLVDLLTECEEVYRANGQRRHAACFRRARDSVLDAVFPEHYRTGAEPQAPWWGDDAVVP